MQCPCQGGLIVILISYHTGLFELPDRTERLKKEREKKKKKNKMGEYLIVYFMCYVLSLTFGEWAVIRALAAWNWSIECGIYSLHPCISILGGIPIFIIKHTKYFFLAVASTVDHGMKALNCNLNSL